MEPFDVKAALQKISDILTLTNAASGYERIFHLIVDAVRSLTRCQSVAIIMIEPKTEYLNIEMSQGISYTFQKNFRRTLATGQIGKLLWEGKPLFVADAAMEPETASEVMLEHPFGSCYCIPISVDQKTLGYLHVDFKESSLFCVEARVAIQISAELAGFAYKKAKVLEEYIRSNPMDEETGLLRYEEMIKRLKELLPQPELGGGHFGLILYDIDNFKEVINVYGYETSRELLKDVAQHLTQWAPYPHIVGRYGHDEYLILCPKAFEEEVAQLAERLRERVAMEKFTGKRIKTTLSGGVALYPDHGVKMENLLLAARRATFESQRRGRNKVTRLAAEAAKGIDG